MAQTIKLKRSATQNAVPTTSQLALGEVALNTYDGKMYIKKSVGGTESIVEIGGDATSSSGLDFTGNLNLEDNVRIVIGDGNDLQIWHGGVDSYITNDSGHLQFIQKADDKDIQFYSDDGSGGTTQYMAIDGDEGRVVFNKWTRHVDGARILVGTGGDLAIYHDGSNSYIDDQGTGNLFVRADNLVLTDADGTQFLRGTANTDVKLYYANAIKFTTTSAGAQVSGKLFVSDTSNGVEIGASKARFKVNGDDTVIDAIPTGGGINFRTGGAVQAVKIDSDGRLLVNTTSSIDNLAKIQVLGDSSSLARITLKDVDGTNQYTYFEQSGGGTRINTQNGTSNGFFTIGGWNGTASSDFVRVTSAGRVGIGTTAPNYVLDVQSSVGGILARFKDTDSSHTGIVIAGDTNAGWVGNNSITTGEGIYYQNSLNAMRMYTNGSEAMRIDSSGRVGIGTTSPGEKLEVTGTIKQTGSYNLTLSGGANITGSNHLYIKGNNSYVRIDAPSNSIYYNAGTDHVFGNGDGSTEYMRIDTNGTNAGNVGIGTTSPSQKLDVEGLIRSGGIAHPEIELVPTGSVGNADIRFDGTSLDIRSNSSGAYLTLQTATTERLKITNTGNFEFNNGNFTEVGTITASGIVNIGGGTSYFSEKLLVQGRTRVAGQLDISAGTGYGNYAKFTHDDTELEIATVRSAGTNGQIVLSPLGTAALTLDTSQNAVFSGTISSGNITTSGYLAGPATFTIDPAAVGDNTGTVVIAGNLQVDGTTTTINSTTLTVDDKNITLASGSTNAAAANGAGLTVDCGSDADATFTYEATPDSFRSNKNFEIYTNGSLGQLSVGRTSDQAIRLYADDNYNRIFAYQDADSNTDHFFDLVRSFQGTGRADFRILNGSDVHMLIDKTGNVGIGTSSPASNLHISSTSTSTLTLQNTSNAGNASLHFRDESNNDQYKVLYDLPNNRAEQHFNGNGLRFYSNQISAEVAKIGFGNNYNTSYFAGRVGVGTNAPLYPLEVSGTGTVSIAYQRTGTGVTAKKWGFHSDNSNTYWQNITDNLLAITVSNAGNVGIGTTAPQSKIEVNLHSGATSSLMDANTVNDVQLIRAGYSSSAATTSNAGAKWGLRFVGRNDSNYDNQKSGAIYAVSEDSGAGYNRNVGLAFHTSGFDSNHAERMRITNTGNVAIGQTTAPQKLTVSGNITVTGTTGIQIATLSRVSDAGRFELRDSGGNTRVQINASGNSYFNASSSSFGIGTASPQRNLDVRYGLNIFGSGGYTELMLRGRAGTAQNLGAWHWSIRGDVGGSNDDLMLLRFTGGNSPSYAGTSMQIRNDNGYVGIGTNIGQATRQLHVKSSNYSVARLERDGAGGGVGLEFRNGDGNIWQIGNDGDEVLRFYYAGSNKFQITSSGAARFNSAFTLPTSDGSGNQVLQTDGSGNVSWASISGVGAPTYMEDADGDTKIQVEESADEDVIRFDTAGSQRMVIDSGGNFGFGVNSPVSYFHVYKSSTGVIARIEGTSGRYLYTGTDSGGHYLEQVGTSAAERIFRIQSSNGSSTYTVLSLDGHNQRIYTNSGTKVGIGTSSLTNQFHVSGNARIEGNLMAGGSAASNVPARPIHIKSAGDAAALRIEDSTSSNTVFDFRVTHGEGLRFINVTGGITPLFVGTDGNVGIGTTTPSSLLHLSSIADAVLIVEADTNNSGETENARIELRQDGNNVAGYLYTEGNAGQTATGTLANTTVLESKGAGNDVGIHFATGGKAPSQSGGATNGTVRMTVLGNGNVGIGTTAPTRQLQVKGSGNTALAITSPNTNYVQLGLGDTDDDNYAQLILDNSSNKLQIQNGGGGVVSDRGITLDSSENVGIGTSSPAADLHVNGTWTINRGTISINGPANGLAGVGITSNNIYRGGLIHRDGTAGQSLELTAYSSESLLLKTTNTTRLAITSGGNVGIGITTPSRKLDVSAPGNDGIRIASANALIGGGASGGDTQLIYWNGSNAYYGRSSLGGSVSKHEFRTGGTTRLTIDSSGNVGIGTTSPDAKLQVAYNGGHTSGNISLSHSNLDIYNPLEANTNEKGAILTFSDHYQDANGYPRTVRAAIKGGTDTVGNTADGFLAFYTDSGSANSATERMRIDNSGRVGIGNQNPASQLHISGGNLLLDNALEIRTKDTGGNVRTVLRANSSNELEYGWSANAPVKFMGGGSYTERMRIHTNGNVGIGTIAPAKTLDVAANGSSQGIHLNISGVGRLQMYADGDRNYFKGLSGNGHRFTTTGGALVEIQNGGNVGIGTAAPQAVLDLGNGTNGRGIAWGGSNGTAHYNTIWSEYSSASIIIGAGLKGATGSSTFLNPFTGTYGYAAIELDSFSDDGIKFYTGADSSRTKDAAITPTEHMRLTNAGRLGIGTTSPSYKLQVNGSGIVARFTDGTSHMDLYSGSNLTEISTVNPLLFSVGGTERMRIDGSTKNVGIGTSTLSTITTGVATLSLGGTNSGISGGIAYQTNGTPEAYHYTQSDFLLHQAVAGVGQRFLTNNTEAMRIDTSGTVYIGSTSDSGTNYHRLSSDGFVRHKRSGQVVAVFDRDSTNGDIILIRKDGGTIGSIGTGDGNSVYIESPISTKVGLDFRSDILPRSGGALSNGGVDLGAPSYRFRNIELSAAVNVGHASIQTDSTTTSATTQVAIDAFVASEFRSAEFTIQVTNSTDSTYHITKVLLIHDGTTPGITEYGTVFTGSAAEATFDADISSGNVRLLATPASTDSMTFKVVRHCITV